MTWRNPIKAILKNMRVTEVSLVDEGDNPGADVVVIKRRIADTAAAFDDFAVSVAKLNDLASGEEGEEGAALAAQVLKGMNMNIEELNDKLGQIETALETVEKEKDDAVAKVADLEAALAAKDDEIAKLKDATSAADDDGDDDVLKALPKELRESIEKRLSDAEAKAERAEAAIEKANDQRALDAAIEKAKGFGFAEPDKLGAAMHRVEKGKPEDGDMAVIEEALTKAAAVAKADSKLFTSIGKANGLDADDPEAKLRTAALDIQKAKPTLSYEAAYAEAMEANPALYDEISKSRRAH